MLPRCLVTFVTVVALLIVQFGDYRVHLWLYISNRDAQLTITLTVV